MRKLYYLTIFAVLILCQSPIIGAGDKSEVQTKHALSSVFDDTSKNLNTDHFNILYGSDVVEDEKIACILELAYHHFQSLFNGHDFKLKMPKEKLKWVIFSSSDSFNRFALETENQNLSWLKGYYSTKTNLVAIVTPEKMSKWQVKAERTLTPDIIACPPDAETDLAKVLHEVAHQLSFNSGLQKRKVLYPTWASEGLAMAFERSFLTENFKASRYTDIRARQLVQLYRNEKMIPLYRFLAMSRPDNSDCAIDVYAQAWGLFTFLCEQKTDSLRKYFLSLHNVEAGWRDQRTIRSEFYKAFGSLDDIEPQWKLFLETLSSQQ